MHPIICWYLHFVDTHIFRVYNFLQESFCVVDTPCDVHRLILLLEVYRMWDFQYSRIRMRSLHFNIRGYRMLMRILNILLY